jgi:hypothetical protein
MYFSCSLLVTLTPCLENKLDKFLHSYMFFSPTQSGAASELGAELLARGGDDLAEPGGGVVTILRGRVMVVAAERREHTPYAKTASGRYTDASYGPGLV